MTQLLTGPTTLWLTTTVHPGFPLGPQVHWPLPGGGSLPCTLLDGANRYLVVGLDPDRAHEHEQVLEALRQQVAVRAGWVPTDNEPKLSCVAATGDPARPLAFRVRQNPVQGWHPAMAASGVLALAAAAATAGTVVADLLGGPADGTVEVRTPGGNRGFFVTPAGDGLLVEYQLSPVSAVAALEAVPA
jgi:hypothetical protein